MEDSFSRPAPEDEGGEARSDHRRVTPRDSLFLQATLRRAGTPTPFTMRVRNLSPGGMMAEIGDPFVVGDRVEIDLRGIGTIEGSVMWRSDHRAGIAFAEPIDPLRARKSVAARVTQPVAAPPPRTPRRPRLFGE